MSLRIEKGKSYLVVYLRPQAGNHAPVPVDVKAEWAVAGPLKVEIGKAGELIFSKRVYHKIGLREYDEPVKVFAPLAWLYYEYKLEVGP